MPVFDLSTKVSAYGNYAIKVNSQATGYDDSDDATLTYSIGATIAINNGVITVVSVIAGITAFKIFVDGTLLDTVPYDGSASWSVDMTTYTDIPDGKKSVQLGAVGTGIDDNLSNAVTYFAGVAPIYGVSGMYNSAPALTRTDDAVDMDFVINSSSGSIDSDFNNVFPWIEATVVEDTAGKMLLMPEMYFRVGVDNAGRITDIAVSAMPGTTGNWYAVAPFYVGCYGGSVSSSRLKSVSGATRQANYTRANFRTYAVNNGSNYCQLDLYHRTVLMFLWWIEFATKKSDSIMTGRISGSGTSGGSTLRPTGGTDEVETPSGYETAYAQMRYHYIEDFVGNMYEFVDGVCCSSISAADYVTADPTKFNDTHTDMVQLGYVNPPVSGQEVTAFGWDDNNPFMCVPIESIANSSYNTYFCDRTTGYGASYPVLYCGAYYNNSSAYSGLSYFNRSGAASGSSNLGARLLKLS